VLPSSEVLLEEEVHSIEPKISVLLLAEAMALVLRQHVPDHLPVLADIFADLLGFGDRNSGIYSGEQTLRIIGGGKQETSRYTIQSLAHQQGLGNLVAVGEWGD